MIEIRDPGTLADSLEVEIARFRHVETVYRVPAALADQADALERIASMLREADDRGQAVDLGDEVMRLIRQFRGVLATLGGAPAQA
jgi:hypothetical protein